MHVIEEDEEKKNKKKMRSEMIEKGRERGISGYHYLMITFLIVLATNLDHKKYVLNSK